MKMCLGRFVAMIVLVTVCGILVSEAQVAKKSPPDSTELSRGEVKSPFPFKMDASKLKTGRELKYDLHMFAKDSWGKDIERLVGTITMSVTVKGDTVLIKKRMQVTPKADEPAMFVEESCEFSKDDLVTPKKMSEVSGRYEGGSNKVSTSTEMIISEKITKARNWRRRFETKADWTETSSYSKEPYVTKVGYPFIAPSMLPVMLQMFPTGKAVYSIKNIYVGGSSSSRVDTDSQNESWGITCEGLTKVATKKGQEEFVVYSLKGKQNMKLYVADGVVKRFEIGATSLMRAKQLGILVE